MIVKETLSDQIYFELRKAILSREIPLGSKIVNRQLQERFNVILAIIVIVVALMK